MKAWKYRHIAARLQQGKPIEQALDECEEYTDDALIPEMPEDFEPEEEEQEDYEDDDD